MGVQEKGFAGREEGGFKQRRRGSREHACGQKQKGALKCDLYLAVLNIRAHVSVCVCERENVCIHVFMHACMQAGMHVHMHTCMCACMLYALFVCKKVFRYVGVGM